MAANLTRWGYEWAYEPRAYAAGRSQYLPDFEVSVHGKLRFVLEVRGPRQDPEDVFKTMRVVWASEPQAYLVLLEAEVIREAEWSPLGVPRASLMLLHPEFQEKPAIAAFCLCECGTVRLALVTKGFVGGLMCRGCLKNETQIRAYLDPTERES